MRVQLLVCELLGVQLLTIGNEVRLVAAADSVSRVVSHGCAGCKLFRIRNVVGSPALASADRLKSGSQPAENSHRNKPGSCQHVRPSSVCSAVYCLSILASSALRCALSLNKFLTSAASCVRVHPSARSSPASCLARICAKGSSSSSARDSRRAQPGQRS